MPIDPKKALLVVIKMKVYEKNMEAFIKGVFLVQAVRSDDEKLNYAILIYFIVVEENDDKNIGISPAQYVHFLTRNIIWLDQNLVGRFYHNNKINIETADDTVQYLNCFVIQIS